MSELTHLDKDGRASMVDVGHKETTSRQAVAEGSVYMAPSTLAAIRDGNVPKGDVLASARIAGILAAKRTPDLIPLCHPPSPDKDRHRFRSRRTPKSRHSLPPRYIARGRTGVEMEALTAVSVAALTIYDMAKALEKTMTIGNVSSYCRNAAASQATGSGPPPPRPRETPPGECTPCPLRRPPSGGRLQE